MAPPSSVHARSLAVVFALLLTAGCATGDGSHPGPESTESPTFEGDYRPIADWCSDVDVDKLAELLSGATFGQSHLSVGDDPDDAWVRVPDYEGPSRAEVTHCTLNTIKDTGIAAHWYTLVYATPEEARGAFDANPPSAPDAPAGVERLEVDGWQQSLLQTYPDPSVEEWAAGSMFGRDNNLVLMVDVRYCFMRTGAPASREAEACDDEELIDFITEVGEQTQRSLAG